MTSRELHDWIVFNTEAGHSPNTLLERLLEAGWSETLALDALESALHIRAAELGVVTVPEPDLVSSPTSVTVGGKQIDVLLSICSPRLVVFRKFLSDEECDAVIEAARPRLAVSTVIDNDSGANAVHEGRVSEGMFFARCESRLVRSIEERIAELVRWPLDHGETIQVLRYGIGGKYDPHYDYFEPTLPGSVEPIRVAGNRVGTFIMVLQAPIRGGSTLFPDVGVEVFAQRGNAVFFSYARPAVSTKTRHGGAPVVEGEKWIATKWLREKPFNV
ncbi:MAG: 2-oxoglutarate-dependent dioxygenase [Gammaproteobacteria bacterium]|nr:2-oxoglutarate-dependent dioxygenase [Gammaproteobacteria bacterium]